MVKKKEKKTRLGVPMKAKKTVKNPQGLVFTAATAALGFFFKSLTTRN